MKSTPETLVPEGWYPVLPNEISSIWQPGKSLSWKQTLSTDYGISNATPLYMTKYNFGTYVCSGILNNYNIRLAGLSYFVLNGISGEVQRIAAPTELEDILEILSLLNGRLKSSDPSIKEELKLEEVRTVYDDRPPPAKMNTEMNMTTETPAVVDSREVAERPKLKQRTLVESPKSPEESRVEQDTPLAQHEIPERACTRTPDTASVEATVEDSFNEEEG